MHAYTHMRIRKHIYLYKGFCSSAEALRTQLRAFIPLAHWRHLGTRKHCAGVRFHHFGTTLASLGRSGASSRTLRRRVFWPLWQHLPCFWAHLRETHKNTCFLFSSIFGRPPAAPGSPSCPKAPKPTPKRPHRDPKGTQGPSQRSQSDPKDVKREAQGTPKHSKGLQSQPEGGLSVTLDAQSREKT
jgi:hypothetical protein